MEIYGVPCNVWITRRQTDLKCDEIMTRNPVIANPDLLAYDALRLMEDRPSQISVLPVVNEDGHAWDLSGCMISSAAGSKKVQIPKSNVRLVCKWPRRNPDSLT